MNTETSKIIDKCAMDFFKTRDESHFDLFAKHAKPLIEIHVAHTCNGSTKWDADELFSILFADMWRLFKVYKPEVDKKFHWLMLRQLKNKTINYIQNKTGRVYKKCFICDESQETNAKICTTCGASMKRPHATTGIENYDLKHCHSPDYLQEVENKQLVDIVLNATKEDPMTHKILTMLLEGHTKSEISREVAIAQNAVNNRIRKCERILNKIRG